MRVQSLLCGGGVLLLFCLALFVQRPGGAFAVASVAKTPAIEQKSTEIVQQQRPPTLSAIKPSSGTFVGWGGRVSLFSYPAVTASNVPSAVRAVCLTCYQALTAWEAVATAVCPSQPTFAELKARAKSPVYATLIWATLTARQPLALPPDATLANWVNSPYFCEQASTTKAPAPFPLAPADKEELQAKAPSAVLQSLVGRFTEKPDMYSVLAIGAIHTAATRCLKLTPSVNFVDSNDARLDEPEVAQCIRKSISG